MTIHVTAVSPVLSDLLAWADDDPEVRMQTSSIEAFRAGWEAAGKSAEPVPVAPSIVLLAPSFREWLIVRYREIADCERDELKRPAEEADVRQKIALLEREGDVTLADLLDRIG